MFDYQAPKDDDSYRNYQSTSQFLRRYFVLLPLAALCLYDMLLVRRNQFSRNREYKFVNRPFESLLGSLVSRKVIADNKNNIYKQDTEEVKLVNRALNKLIEANELQHHFRKLGSGNDENEATYVRVTLVHNDTVIMYLNMD